MQILLVKVIIFISYNEDYKKVKEEVLKALPCHKTILSTYIFPWGTSTLEGDVVVILPGCLYYTNLKKKQNSQVLISKSGAPAAGLDPTDLHHKIISIFQ